MAKEFRAQVHFQMFSVTCTEIITFVHAHLFQGIMCIFFRTVLEINAEKNHERKKKASGTPI